MQKAISLVQQLLIGLYETDYIIIRSFDVHTHAFDIDIVVLDLFDAEDLLRKAAMTALHEDNICVTFKKGQNNLKVDVSENSILKIRLDLVNPEYFQEQDYILKQTFVIQSIYNYDTKETPHFGTLKVASNIDECVYRYFEYMKMYLLREDKIKHIDYLNAKFQTSPQMTDAIMAKITNSIMYNHTVILKHKTTARTFTFMTNDISRAIASIKRSGFKSTLSKVLKRLNR